MVDVIAKLALAVRFDVVEVSWDKDTYPRLPKPATVDWRPVEEM